MFTDLEEHFSEFQSDWDITEGDDGITITSEHCSGADCIHVIEQCAAIREYFEGRNLLFEVDEQRDNFSYRLLWEPRGTVICSEVEDSDSPSERIFSETEAAQALDDIRNDRINDRDSLEDCLQTFADEAHVEISFRFPIPSSSVGEFVSEALDVEFDVTFYFSLENLFTDIRELQIEEAKDFFCPSNSKHLFVILDAPGHEYGDELGFFSLGALERTSIDDYKERTTNLSKRLQAVGRECAIDRFEEVYLPPTFFDLVTSTDEEFIQPYHRLVARFQIVFFLIGVSNVARLEAGQWTVRIQGRKVIESTMQLVEESGDFQIEFQDSDSSTMADVNHELAGTSVDVFEWVYESRVTDRITVFRNIVTLYTTSLEGLLAELDEIFESTKANLKFYVEESIDEFMNFQQEVSNYALETQRELSSLRRDLMNNLSRDVFRVFGFVIVTWVAIFLQIQDVTSIRYALSLSLAPVFVYLILAYRSVQGLDHQFDSVEKTQSRYHTFFKRRIDENILSEIINEEAEDKLHRRFGTDLKIYYGLIVFLLVLAVIVWIYLLLLNGDIPGFLQNLSQTS